MPVCLWSNSNGAITFGISLPSFLKAATNEELVEEPVPSAIENV